METALWRRALAEAIGTYAIVVAGCGAILVNTQTGALGHLGVALAFGLTVAVMIGATGHLCMAHFNPAVTVAFALTRHFPWREVPVYLAAQFVAAVLGALTLVALFGGGTTLGATVPAGPAGQSLLLEILLTAFLMFVITSVATDGRANAVPTGLAIGFTVALGALWGGPISGASMNPARSFGPALVAGVWTEHWLYWLGPFVGATVGAVLYQVVRGKG